MCRLKAHDGVVKIEVLGQDDQVVDQGTGTLLKYGALLTALHVLTQSTKRDCSTLSGLRIRLIAGATTITVHVQTTDSDPNSDWVLVWGVNTRDIPYRTISNKKPASKDSWSSWSYATSFPAGTNLHGTVDGVVPAQQLEPEHLELRCDQVQDLKTAAAAAGILPGDDPRFGLGGASGSPVLTGFRGQVIGMIFAHHPALALGKLLAVPSSAFNSSYLRRTRKNRARPLLILALALLLAALGALGYHNMWRPDKNQPFTRSAVGSQQREPQNSDSGDPEETSTHSLDAGITDTNSELADATEDGPTSSTDRPSTSPATQSARRPGVTIGHDEVRSSPMGNGEGNDLPRKRAGRQQ